MEIVDVYDGNRRPLGRTRDRTERLADGEFIVVVGTWVMNPRGEILLTKRHPDKRYAPNLWENTGGHARAGESSRAAIARELEEETGVRAMPEEFLLLGTTKVPPFFGDNYAVIKDVPASGIRLQEGETADAKWVSYAEFRRMGDAGELAPSVLEHLAQYRAGFEAALERALAGAGGGAVG